MSAPVGFVGDDYADNYYDCHERTSGIYPGTFCAGASVLFGLLSLSTDPKHGLKRFMGLPYKERRALAFKQASFGMNDQQTTVAMILEIWKWADIGRDGNLSEQDAERWIRETEAQWDDGEYKVHLAEGAMSQITDFESLSHEVLGNPMIPANPRVANSKPVPRMPTRAQFVLWYSAAWRRRLVVPAMHYVAADNAVGSPWLKGQLAKIRSSHEIAVSAYQYVQLLEDPVKRSLRDLLEKEPQTMVTVSKCAAIRRFVVLDPASVEGFDSSGNECWPDWCVPATRAQLEVDGLYKQLGDAYRRKSQPDLAVFLKDADGKVGQATMNPGFDGCVKLRWLDGTVSDWIKATALSPAVWDDIMSSPFMRGKSFQLDNGNVITSRHPMSLEAQPGDTFELGPQVTTDEPIARSDFAVNDLVWFHKSATVEQAAARWTAHWCVKQAM